MSPTIIDVNNVSNCAQTDIQYALRILASNSSKAKWFEHIHFIVFLYLNNGLNYFNFFIGILVEKSETCR